jgi:hypothetical protein
MIDTKVTSSSAHNAMKQACCLLVRINNHINGCIPLKISIDITSTFCTLKADSEPDGDREKWGEKNARCYVQHFLDVEQELSLFFSLGFLPV